MAGLRWVDVPPVWLIAAIAAAWGIGRVEPEGLGFGGAWADLAAGLLIGGGLLLMGLAVAEMRRARTTVIPHLEPSRLVTSGIFRRTRNPIYLGDALVLLGAILRLDAPLALPLLPVFVWWIERHFIVAEEARLRRAFKADFARYCGQTRRWL